MTTTTLRAAGITIVALRLPVQMLHGVAHSALQIHMAAWQNAYILLVITVLPLVSAFLLWRRNRLGFLLLFLSMLGSLVFGGYYHFVASGPDNVNELGHHAWTVPFQLSAVLLLALEAEGAAVGIGGLIANRRQQ